MAMLGGGWNECPTCGQEKGHGGSKRLCEENQRLRKRVAELEEAIDQAYRKGAEGVKDVAAALGSLGVLAVCVRLKREEPAQNTKSGQVKKRGRSPS